MFFMKLTVLAILLVGFCAPMKSSTLARDTHKADESVVYPDYRRSTSDESVVYPEYQRNAPSNDDKSIIYTDYRRSVSDEFVI
ncbi:hypothetical protein BCIN_03g05260 [Botrytis cinerea B05.10]|uniref:Secreted protein n=1 Tax=Botryotinia fuckeliana (strain B05.10) TaxID=332648 RepID=A0A384JCZ8_BOTFB|nr:hypothetical protein BCIN_03g05260 [Botrytis cinerea B05.10]ATZ48297.1 hypothetical protein BCIN_03g05260 [Botrytis cinerea B05.10]